MMSANWNVKEKEKFRVVADPVFCFFFCFCFCFFVLFSFFVVFFEKRYSVGRFLYSSDFRD